MSSEHHGRARVPSSTPPKTTISSANESCITSSINTYEI